MLAGRQKKLAERFLNLRGDFESESVEALREVANVLQELIVKDYGRDGGDESGSGGEERFGNTGSDGAKTGGARCAETGERVDDAPDGAEKSDERRDGAGRGQPGHAFFGAANFFRGGELHVHGDGLKTLEFSAGSGAADLALQFAIPECIDGGERGTGGGEGLGIGYAVGGAKDAEELVAFAFNTAEKAEFLEDHGPGDDRENQEKRENCTGDPSGLFENATEIG